MNHRLPSHPTPLNPPPLSLSNDTWHCSSVALEMFIAINVVTSRTQEETQHQRILVVLFLSSCRTSFSISTLDVVVCFILKVEFIKVLNKVLWKWWRLNLITLVAVSYFILLIFTYKNVTVTRAVNDPAAIVIGLPLIQKWECNTNWPSLLIWCALTARMKTTKEIRQVKNKFM